MSDTKRKYFAAANTANGFISYYGEVFGNCKHIDIIKGGSGTGKSRLISDLAEYARQKQRKTELFYCSFDPDSLDGVIIDGERAVVDGTAPHIYEPTLPGVRDNIIDLGRFWERALLERYSKDISMLMNEKKHCFDMAYKYLSAAGDVRDVNKKICERFLERDKIRESAESLAMSCEARADRTLIRIRSAFGREGLVSFDGYEHMSERLYRVSDVNGSCLASSYIETVAERAQSRSALSAVSYAPLEYKKADAVLLADKTAVCISGDDVEWDISEFISAEIKSEYERLAENMHIFQILLKKAEQSLKAASAAHFEIEKKYISAMDFDSKEKYSRELFESMGF